MNNVATMLRHMADECEKLPPDEQPQGGAILVLNARGEWSATMTGLGPFGATALVEYAKVDLVCGGGRWEEFAPQSTPTAAPH
jgi:hypothetical protein